MPQRNPFRPQRNLTQRPSKIDARYLQASPPDTAPAYSYRPEFGGYTQDRPVNNRPPNLRGMTEDQMAAPLQQYLAESGFLPNMVYNQNPMQQGPAQSPQSPPGFFGGIGNSMDQTVQGIGRFFGGQGAQQPPRRDPSQEWIQSRPNPYQDDNGYEGDPYGRYRKDFIERNRPVPIEGGEGSDEDLFGRYRRQREGARKNPMHTLPFLYPGHPDYVAPRMTYQQQWRIDHGRDPNTADFIPGVDDKDEDGNVPKDGGYQLMSGQAQYPPRARQVQDGEDSPYDGGGQYGGPDGEDFYDDGGPYRSGDYQNPLTNRPDQPFYVEGTDQRTGERSSAPITGEQSAAFNNPFSRRKPDGNIPPVSYQPPQGRGVQNPPQGSSGALRETQSRNPMVERTEWDSLGEFNAADPSWLPRRRAERRVGDQVRGMMDQNSQEPPAASSPPRATNGFDPNQFPQPQEVLDEQRRTRPRSFSPQGQGMVDQADDRANRNPTQGALDQAAQGASRAIQPDPTRRRQPLYGTPYGYNAPGANEPQTPYDGPTQQPGPGFTNELVDALGNRIMGGLRGASQAIQPDTPPRSSGTSGLAENPEFPQGQGPLRKFGESGSQLMGDYERGAKTRMKNERLRELADAINTRSGVRNPMVPNSPLRLDESGRQLPKIDPTSTAMKEGIQRGRRVDEFLEGTPIPTSSGEARSITQSVPPDLQNPMTMRPGSGYNGNIGYANDPNRPSPEDNFQSAQQSAEFQSGNRVRPGNDAFGDRFRQEPGPGYDGPKTRELKRIEALKATPEYQARAAEYAKQKSLREKIQDRNFPAGTEAEQKRRDDADAEGARKRALHDEFKSNANGMNYRQYDRLQNQNSRTLRSMEQGRISRGTANFRMQTRTDKALRRSGRPDLMSGAQPGARMFPDVFEDMSKRGQGGASAGTNPMSEASEAMRPGGIVTPESADRGRSLLATMRDGGTTKDGTVVPPLPMFAEGLANDSENIQGVHFAVQDMVQSGQDLGPADLENMHQVALAMQAGHGTPDYDPFDMTYGYEGISGVDKQHTEVFGPMYKELAAMKAPTAAQLRSWWGRFKARIAPKAPWFGVEAMPGVSESIGGYEYPLPANPMKP